jgi:hypothetical protein
VSSIRIAAAAASPKRAFPNSEFAGCWAGLTFAITDVEKQLTAKSAINLPGFKVLRMFTAEPVPNIRTAV